MNISIIKKAKKPILLFILLMYVFCICPVKIQNDILFDIKLGEKYINQGIGTLDNFSFHKNLNYISQHFMVNIISYLIHNLWGFKGLYILEIILTSILALLFYKANTIYAKSKGFAYIFTFIQLFLIKYFCSQRAQMYSYILFLLEYIFLEKFLSTGKKKYLISISIIPLFLSNFHAGTLPIFYIIIFVYLLNLVKINIERLSSEEKYNENLKYLFIPLIVGFILMFINPFGLDSVTYFFKTLNNEFINKNIIEFQKSTIENNPFIYICMLIIFFSYLFSVKKIKIHQLCFFLGSTLMTLLSIRHFSIFVIMLFVNIDSIELLARKIYIFGKNKLDKKYQKYYKYIIITSISIIILLMGYASIDKERVYLPKDTYPIEAINYIKNNIDSDKKIFNSYLWGAHLMYNNIPVFIDSRCDLYTKNYNKGVTVADDYIDIINCNRDYNLLLKKYNIDYLLIEKYSPLYNNVLTNCNYKLIYHDEVSSIFEVKLK